MMNKHLTNLFKNSVFVNLASKGSTNNGYNDTAHARAVTQGSNTYGYDYITKLITILHALVLCK